MSLLFDFSTNIARLARSIFECAFFLKSLMSRIRVAMSSRDNKAVAYQPRLMVFFCPLLAPQNLLCVVLVHITLQL